MLNNLIQGHVAAERNVTNESLLCCHFTDQNPVGVDLLGSSRPQRARIKPKSVSSQLSVPRSPSRGYA